MADDTKLLRGYFKGVPIDVAADSVANTSGGIKHSAKQFPNTGRQSIEPLGKMTRSYRMQVVISDKNGLDYFAYKKTLLGVFESNESGILIHPTEGRIDNVYALSFNLAENFGQFGYATVDVDFGIDNSSGIPLASSNVGTQVKSLNDVVQSSVNTDTETTFGVTNSFAGNFGAAVSKVREIVDLVEDSISFVGDISDNIDEFTADVRELSADINSIVTDPSRLADSITNLFSGVEGLYNNAGVTFDIFERMFGFGDGDSPITPSTAGLQERSTNNNVLNSSVGASSLGYAYLSATLIDYQTSDEVSDVLGILDAQYNAVQSGNSSQDVKTAMTNLRLIVIQVFDDLLVNTPRVITIKTTPTSLRLLAYDYYGNDDNGIVLANLNGISDASFVEGEIKVISS